MSRRKLGTSRKNKGKQHVKYQEPEPDDTFRELSQDDALDKSTDEKLVPATQAKELGQGSEDGLSMCNTDTTLDYSKNLLAKSCPEDVKESLISKDYTKLEGAGSLDKLQPEELKDNILDCIPEFTNVGVLSYPIVDHQTIKVTEQYHSSVVDSKITKNDDSNLFWQNANLDGNYSESESHVNTLVSESNLQHKTTDDMLRENTCNHSSQKAIFSLPEEKLHADAEKDDSFKMPEMVEAVVADNTSTLNQNKYYLDVEDQTNADGQEYILKEKNITEREETALGQIHESEDLAEIEPNLDNVKPIPQETSVNQSEADFNIRGNKKKIASSRKNKGRQNVQEPTMSVFERSVHNDVHENTSQKHVCQDTEQSDMQCFSCDNSSVLDQNSMQATYLETHKQGLVLKKENFQENPNKNISYTESEIVEKSADIKGAEAVESESPCCDDTEDYVSEDYLWRVQKVSVDTQPKGSVADVRPENIHKIFTEESEIIATDTGLLLTHEDMEEDNKQNLTEPKHQDASFNINKETNENLNLGINKSDLGDSHTTKIKCGTTDEHFIESASHEEVFETEKISQQMELGLEELDHGSESEVPFSHDNFSSSTLSVNSSEVQTSMSTICPKTDTGSLISKSKSLQEEQKRDAEAELIEKVDADTIINQSEETTKDDLTEGLEVEVYQTERQESPPVDTDHTIECCEIVSGNLTQQDEMSESTEETILGKDGRAHDGSEEQVGVFENIDHHSQETEIFQNRLIDDCETNMNQAKQHEKKGAALTMIGEENILFDFTPQEGSERVAEQTDKSFSTPVDDSLPVDLLECPENKSESLKDETEIVTADTSLTFVKENIILLGEYNQIPSKPKFHEQKHEAVTSNMKRKSLQEDQEQLKSDTEAELIEKSDADIFINNSEKTTKEDLTEVKEPEVHQTEIQESPSSDIDANIESCEIVSGNSTEQDKAIPERYDDLQDGTKQNCEQEKGDPALSQMHEFDDDYKPKTDQTEHEEKKGDISDKEEETPASSHFQPESGSFVSLPQGNTESVDEKTGMGFHNIGNRRKMGSSRRSKDRHKVKDFAAETKAKPREDVEENRSKIDLNDTTLDKSMSGKKMKQSMEMITEGLVTNVTLQPKMEKGIVAVFSSEKPTLKRHPNIFVYQMDSDGSCCKQVQGGEPPSAFSITDTDNKRRDESSKLIRKDGNFQENIEVSEPCVGPATLEIYTDKKSIIGQADYESLEDKVHEQVLKPSEIQEKFQSSSTFERGSTTAESFEIISQNPTDQMPNQKRDTDTFSSDANLQSAQLLSDTPLLVSPKITKERSTTKHYTEVKHCVEQVASTKGTTDGERAKRVDLFEAAGTHKVEYVGEDHNPEHNLDEYQSTQEGSHSGLKTPRNRRKFGSSRRYEGKRHPMTAEDHPEHEEENEKINEERKQRLETKSGQENTEIVGLVEKGTHDFALTDDRKAEILLDENLECFSENVLDNRTVVASDVKTSSEKLVMIISNKEMNEQHAKHMKKSENLSCHAGHDTDKNNLMQSPQTTVWKGESERQANSYQEDTIIHTSGKEPVRAQDKALEQQTREALPLKKDSRRQEVQLQQPNKMTEPVESLVTEEHRTGATNSVDLQDLKVNDVEEEALGAANEVNTSSSFVLVLQEPTLNAIIKEDTPATMEAHTSEQTHSDSSETLKEMFKQKKKKIGSRRTQISRKGVNKRHNSDESESDIKNPDKTDGTEDLSLTTEVLPTISVQQGSAGNKTTDAHMAERGVSDQQSNNVSSLLFPEQSDSLNKFVVSSMSAAKQDLRLGTETTQVGFTSTATEITSAEVEPSNTSGNKLLLITSETNSGISEQSLVHDFIETKQYNELKQDNINVIQVQGIKERSDMCEGDHRTAVGPMSASPNLNPASRRRKMGSTRKNLGSHIKKENLDEKHEVENIVGGDETAESVSVLEEKRTQHNTENNDIDQRKQCGPIETRSVGGALLKPLDNEQEGDNPVTQSPETETEQTANYPPSNSSICARPDSPSGGKRKKFGSNRKSRFQQSNKDQNIQDVRAADAETEGKSKVAPSKSDELQGGESPDLHTLSQVKNTDEEASSSATIPQAKDVARVVQLMADEVHQGQQEQSRLSFGSESYNVVMVGESSVGKTSFMKRAQSGKFSLDLPASVGLDFYMWTVVVDGKAMALKLWDTAGQERFHSTTRQIFHKAQAFFLMYDITSSQSFSAVSYWANSIQENAPENVTVLLLGNKSDHAKRQVKAEQGYVLAKEYNFEFMECSAATGENVIEALETVARMLSQRADLREEATAKRHEQPAQKKMSKCC